MYTETLTNYHKNSLAQEIDVLVWSETDKYQKAQKMSFFLKNVWKINCQFMVMK